MEEQQYLCVFVFNKNWRISRGLMKSGHVFIVHLKYQIRY